MNAQTGTPDLRPQILKAVHEVVKAAGPDAWDAFRAISYNGGSHFHMKVENGPYMALVIEAWNTAKGSEISTGEFRRVSVAHYYEQNGDLVPDPELEMTDAGYPVALNQQGFRAVCAFKDGVRVMIRPQAKRSVDSFSRMWAANIRAQGFAKAAKAAGGRCWSVD